MPASQMSFQLCPNFRATWNVKSVTTDGPPVLGQPNTWVIAGPLTTELVPGASINHVLTLGDEQVWTQATDVGKFVRLPVSPSSSWALTYNFTFAPSANIPPFVDISSKLTMTNGDGSPVACFQTTLQCAPSS